MAALLAALCSCGKTAAPAAQPTEPESTQAVPAAAVEDDVALPQENDGASTTIAVVGSTMPVVPSTEFRPAAILQEIETAPQTPAPTDPPTEATTAPANEAVTEAEAPAATTTTKPEETTKAATAELLQSSVLAPIQSGTYTETISAFGKDKNQNDKLYKIVRNGQTAYYFTIPDVNLTFKVFPSDGKYYLATPTQYCELTKSQYDHFCSTFNNAFINFSALQYQKTETVREGLRKYTREDFTVGGKTLSLWYNSGSLFKMEMDTDEGKQSLPMTVSGGADARYYTLGDGLEQVDYAALESIGQFADLFFGA